MMKFIIYISNFLTWLRNPYRVFLLSQLMFWMHAPIYFMFYSWHPFDMSKIILHEELYQLFGLLFSYDLQFVCFGNSFFVSCMLECILQHCFNYSNPASSVLVFSQFVDHFCIFITSTRFFRLLTPSILLWLCFNFNLSCFLDFISVLAYSDHPFLKLPYHNLDLNWIS